LRLPDLPWLPENHLWNTLMFSLEIVGKRRYLPNALALLCHDYSHP